MTPLLDESSILSFGGDLSGGSMKKNQPEFNF